MNDTTSMVRRHYGATGLTDRIKAALAERRPRCRTCDGTYSSFERTKIPFRSCPM
jgi:hypothetical protein